MTTIVPAMTTAKSQTSNPSDNNVPSHSCAGLNFVKMLMNIAFPCATLADRKNISPVKIMIHVFAICNP